MNTMDTLCFYYDKDRIIYQLSTDRAEVRYRLDKGKYDRFANKGRIYASSGEKRCLIAGSISGIVMKRTNM
nr:hypothetical protein [Odoribacter splanchnicus]